MSDDIRRRGEAQSIPPVGATGDARLADDIEGEPPPSLASANAWINSPPLTAAALRGKVALIDFCTYICIDCLRTFPYVRAWAEKSEGDELVVIGYSGSVP
jgi:hypothetical protein